jgi:two-component system NtrC family sensor kinase
VSSLKPSVLIFAHPEPEKVHFGAEFLDDLTGLAKTLKSHQFRVVVYPTHLFKNASHLKYLSIIAENFKSSQKILIHDWHDKDSIQILAQIINQGNLFRILPDFLQEEFELSVQGALAEYDLAQQNLKLAELINEQNDNLKRISQELEVRVEKRQILLEESRRKLLLTNRRQQSLHQCLFAVHRANSIGELESLLNEALKESLSLISTRIFFKNFANLQEQEFSRYSLHKAPIMSEQQIFGFIYFIRDLNLPFQREEISFLAKVTKAVSLAIDRLTKLEQAEIFKQEWDATFDAILQPVSLVDANYQVLRVNKTFADQSLTSLNEIIGQKCYEVFLGQKRPCRNCHLGENFRLDPLRTRTGQNSVFEVFSQNVSLPNQTKSVYVNMYKDISTRLRFERQLVESAKIAELGIIGSSIAHELNNPLGGIISFLQLIKMDLKGDESFYSDIDEMEKGALRCKDIIQNLLGFTRKSEDQKEIDFIKLIAQVLKIIEIQTRSLGISIKTEFDQKEAIIFGRSNFLSQALQEILNQGMNTFKFEENGNFIFKGEISLRQQTTEKDYVLEVSFVKRDGLVDSKSDNMGLGMAFDIIREHGGELEVLTPDDHQILAKISLPRY